MNAVAAVFRFTLIEALRNRLPWILAAGLLASLLLAEFAGALAITESAAIKAAAFGATIRIAAVFLLGLFITTSLQREYSDKHIFLYLSLPHRRSLYLFGKLAGCLALAAVIGTAAGLVSLLYAEANHSFLWGLGVTLELWIIAALCILCGLSFANATVSFSVVMAFYILSRSMGDILLLGQSPILQSDQWSFQIIQSMIAWIALLLPDLWNFAGSDRLIHGFAARDLFPVMAQTAIYVPLLAAAALFDLYRKNF